MLFPPPQFRKVRWVSWIVTEKFAGWMCQGQLPQSARVRPTAAASAVETVTAGGQNVIWVYDLSGTSAIRP
jgi:hypothetical protein